MKCDDCVHKSLCQLMLKYTNKADYCEVYIPEKQIATPAEWIPCISNREGQISWHDYKCSKCSHHKDRPMPFCEICGSIMNRKEKRNEMPISDHNNS